MILVSEMHQDGFLRLYRHDRSYPESPVCMLENDRLSLHRNDSFGSRRVIAQSAMGSLGVVLFPSSLDRSQRLAGATEDSSAEHFSPDRALNFTPPAFSQGKLSSAYAVPVLLAESST